MPERIDAMPPPPELAAGTVMSELELEPWLGACGRGVRLYRGCRIIGAERVRLGDACQVDEGVFILAGGGVTLGCHVHLAMGCSVTGGGTCTIGDFAGVGVGVRIITGTDDPAGEGLTNPTVPAEYRAVRRSGVVIGAHALLFTASLVLPGVTIGEGAVVAAGSVVHRDLRPWGIYGGNPLTQIGVRPRDTILRLAGQVRAEERSAKQ